ncbi:MULTISPECIES: restriction endonuclease subunit S [Enterobacteriaceae]|uniref:restriction endonuclease subunit S n=1 Tax=Enterobacteriaceae TaxID=543 RepID=UPI001C0A7ADD|nr:MULTISPECIES: restriction endonuclease subunit S [Enterobacteriaceae]EKF7791382.1 restriction endonuclease subunit S [Escherichia coli]MCV5759120.1 restriction endonuclease subunit S [Escherichia coli]MDY7489017.1 restriction endonuclease subunit S [Escherichia coli]MDY7902696.1 restriction endonuclease subunit S [Escherichia coli]MDZ8590742.1 restriction endonuclease subunit S [Escherichia coli]
MSELSYLEKLLDGVEVEWLPLSGLARIRNGKDHKSLSEGEFPVYGSGGIMRYVDTYAYNKPSVLIPRKGSLGNLFFVNVPFWTVDTIFYTEIDEAQIRPKYLYYFLTTVGLGEMNQAGGVPSQTQSVLNKLKIPIPCPGNPQKSLAIQSEIVRILDKFTAVTAELTAELNMRKKQYNYYRDQLLSFDEEQEKPIYLEKLLDGVEVEWLPLSDLARIRNGKDHKSLSEGEFPVYGSGGIMRYVDTYAYNKPSVLIPRKGSLGNLFFIDVPFWTVDTIFYTEIDEAQIRPKYLYYFLSTVGLGEMNQAGGVPSQTQSVLNKLKIPIPCPDNPEKSLAIQSEIVRILDKFDTLTNSITEGLPREIELRQKQYEYYRDLLFSFPKPETISN